MYLIYHPKRDLYITNSLKIYHDKFGEKNEDPYLWNDKFLHSYCHITKIKSEIGDINFWVSGDTFPNFKHLYCDCVFVVKEKIYWKTANEIIVTDKIVDNAQSYKHHYYWGNIQHAFKRRKRFTLKANEETSFQPQDTNGLLIDIVPFLIKCGLSLMQLNNNMKAGFQAKPLKLDPNIAHLLYKHLASNSFIK